jgi:hypothetical protein
MASNTAITEFRTAWLPHITDAGLRRLVDLLGKGNALLIHGAFTRLMPMGCLASHIAWNHPRTRGLEHEAGVVWLSKVAGLNPALSAVILAWDRAGNADFDLRADLYEACVGEQERRRTAAPAEAPEPAVC